MEAWVLHCLENNFELKGPVVALITLRRGQAQMGPITSCGEFHHSTHLMEEESKAQSELL